MAELGAALLALLGGRDDAELELREQYEDFDDPDDWGAAVLDMFGSKSAAARALGVPRSTLRGWLQGRTPKRGAAWFSGQLRRSLARSMSVQREQELRAGNVRSMVIVGSYGYAGKSRAGDEHRQVDIGKYLDPGVLNDLVDAYLNGADADELHEIFADAINDQGFYADSFSTDPTRGGGWDIEHVGGFN